MDEGELSMPWNSQSAIDAEYLDDNCCLLQDVLERPQQKSGMLQGYSDAVLRAEALEETTREGPEALRYALVEAGQHLRPISQ
jgi:hypothetical protein